jgi:hypothetical protein
MIEYKANAEVIFPEMNSGDFEVSAIAARGSPQFATGPQKCVEVR